MFVLDFSFCIFKWYTDCILGEAHYWTWPDEDSELEEFSLLFLVDLLDASFQIIIKLIWDFQLYLIYW